MYTVTGLDVNYTFNNLYFKYINWYRHHYDINCLSFIDKNFIISISSGIVIEVSYARTMKLVGVDIDYRLNDAPTPDRRINSYDTL